MHDLSVIKLLLNADAYKDFRDYLDTDLFSEDLQPVLRVVDDWRIEHDGHLNEDDLQNLIYAKYPHNHKGYAQILEQLRNVESPATALEAVKALKQNRMLKDLALKAHQASMGRADIQEVLQCAQSIEEVPISEEEISFVTDDLEELLKDTVQSPGLRWRLNTLNTSLGSLRKGDFGFLFARPECFAKGTLVLKSNGEAIAIEKLIPGMKVMGPDSNPRQVIAVSKGKEKMYRVSYSWGESYVCNESHVLQLRAEGNVTTQVKVKDYLNWSDKLKHRFKQYKVGIELPHRAVSIDPYILGLWLGDGTSSAPAFTNADSEVIEYIQQWAESVDLVCNVYERESQGKARTISLSSKIRKKGANTFTQALKGNHLLKNKHIPKQYLQNSREIRLQLLAGLIDTDGWVEKNSYAFCNKNERLIDEVVWLCRSLGLHATKRVKTVNEVIYYVVGIYGDCYEIPVKIERKKITKPFVKPKRNGLNFGFKITEEPSVDEYYGIQVDQDSLYLLNDFTVVHNTGKTTFLASEITFMAEQLSQDQGPIIWFNNEEQGSKVKLRLYQAATGKTLREILQNPPQARKEYVDIIKDKILLLDQAKIDKVLVEKICRTHNPSLIIFDQIDKIYGFKADRYDLELGEKYIWARELAKTYCPVIGVSQADGTAEGIRYLTMNHVANAKTAKQAEADWILGIGKTHDPNFEFIRFLSICKNKLTGDEDTDPALKHGRFEVEIQPMIARYGDLNA